MFLHHVATISLIVFSYVNNMARVGTLVMCLHDAADVLIEVRTGERITYGWVESQTQSTKLCVYIICTKVLIHLQEQLSQGNMWHAYSFSADLKPRGGLE